MFGEARAWVVQKLIQACFHQPKPSEVRKSKF